MNSEWEKRGKALDEGVVTTKAYPEPEKAQCTLRKRALKKKISVPPVVTRPLKNSGQYPQVKSSQVTKPNNTHPQASE